MREYECSQNERIITHTPGAAYLLIDAVSHDVGQLERFLYE